MTSRADTPPSDVPARSWVPTRYEKIPALASQIIGGPVGRYATVGRRSWYPAAAVLSALSSVFIALSVLQRNHCVSKGWATPGSLWRYCYSDLPVTVSVPTGSSPWSNSVTGSQPPLTAIVTWLVRAIVPDGSQLRLQQGMFAFGAAVIALCIAAAVSFMTASMPRGPWAAAHVALSPVLFTAALTSFDAVAVLAVAVALWAYARRSYPVAGAAAMAAALTRPLLGVVLVAIVLVLASQPRRSGLVRSLIGAVGALMVVAAPLVIVADDPFASLRLWNSQAANYGSVWFIFGLSGVGISPTVLTLLAALGWVVALAVGAALVRFERFDHPAAVALAMLVVVVFFARAMPVQAALWALPLVAACAVTWRSHLTWAACEFAYFLVVWPFVARASNAPKALPDGWYVALTVVRLLGWVLLAFCAVRGQLPTDSSRIAVTGRLGKSARTPSTPNV